jgi:hypothetical protein
MRDSRIANPLYRKSALGAFFLLVLALFTAAAVEQPSPNFPSIERLRDHVRYLASDELAGRGVGTPGVNLARDYIAAEFKKDGLLPGGNDGTFLQHFDASIGVVVKQPALMKLNSTVFSLDRDWAPLGVSASGSAQGSVAFAGYGITAKDYGYDDYARIDVKGKIVLILRYEPPPGNAKSPFRTMPQYSTYATLRAKANNARDHGAIAMILIDAEPSRATGRELISTRSSFSRTENGIIAVQMTRAAIDPLLKSRGISLASLKEKIDRDESPQSVAVSDLSASLTVTLEPTVSRAENVIGILPGSDPKLRTEAVVIGAHYDHLGLGQYGSLDSAAEGKIHHGADDNASGTSVLMSVAEMMSRSAQRPARTVIFAAFSGEELGLLGSRHYVQHPPVPLDETKAMLNLDMVGRLHDNRLTVFGSHSASQLSRIAADETHRVGIEIVESDRVGRSDHMSFYNRKIPSLHFFTGTHPDYHRPSDTWEKLNYEGMAKIAEVVRGIAEKIADFRESLTFVGLPSRPPLAEPGTSRGYRPYLGTIPDFGDAVDGVRLAGVTENSPAQLAGLKEGDIIIEFAGSKVGNLEDLAALLGAKKPGDEVSIRVLRMSEPITVRAKLQSRS